MKNTYRRFLAAGMVIALAASAAGCGAAGKDAKQTSAASEKEAENTMDGAWEKAEDGTITDELQEMFDKAMEKQVGVDYKPIELLETQVVAGMNYKFLCTGKAVAPDAEEKQFVVTIYKDTEGSLEILDIVETEGEEGTVQIANPFVDVNSLEEAAAGAGFELTAPDEIEGYQGQAITYIEGQMIQVIYGDEENNLYLRKGAGTEDIAGDYNEYEITEEREIAGQTVTVRANADGIHTITWTDGDYSYAAMASGVLTDGQAEDLVAAVR